MKSKFIKIFLLVLTSLFIVNCSAAEETEELLNSMGMHSQEIDENDISTQVPIGNVITLDDANNYIAEKGVQFVLFIQSIAKPITLVVMVICGLMAIITGLIGGRDGGSGKWILSALISGICYTLVLAAPTLLQLLINFLK